VLNLWVEDAEHINQAAQHVDLLDEVVFAAENAIASQVSGRTPRFADQVDFLLVEALAQVVGRLDGLGDGRNTERRSPGAAALCRGFADLLRGRTSLTVAQSHDNQGDHC
jgi:hypothetical protein